jgi:hypothetical protein
MQNVGVLLFFLISGFLITYTLFQRYRDQRIKSDRHRVGADWRETSSRVCHGDEGQTASGTEAKRRDQELMVS